MIESIYQDSRRKDNLACFSQYLLVTKGFFPSEENNYTDVGFAESYDIVGPAKTKTLVLETREWLGKDFVKPGWGRFVEYEIECRREYLGKIKRGNRVDIGLLDWASAADLYKDLTACPRTVSERLLLEPQYFSPSDKLVHLIGESSLEKIDIDASLMSIARQELSGQFNGYFQNLARRCLANYETNMIIAKDGRLTPEICEEVTSRLGLDPYECRPVFEQIYVELHKVATNCTAMKWGRFSQNASEILLEVSNDYA